MLQTHSVLQPNKSMREASELRWGHPAMQHPSKLLHSKEVAPLKTAAGASVLGSG